jgi:transcriptional regulator with XRE-family HTH domain
MGRVTTTTTPLARLAELVKLDGRTQAAIAEAAGMTPQEIARLISGARANPGIETVRRVLEGLGKSWKDLDPPRRKKAAR